MWKDDQDAYCLLIHPGRKIFPKGLQVWKLFVFDIFRADDEHEK